MLSSDKNIESIAQLIEVLKHYITLQKEYVKLDIIDKVVRLVTALVLGIILFFLIIAVGFYATFAFVYALEPYTSFVGAFSIVALFYLLVLILFIIFRKPWIEKPLVKFLANLLISK